jgi:hypothetical protein
VRVELVNPQATILAEIADRRLTRDDVAMTYAFCIRQSGPWGNDEIDYAVINEAIMERWSLSALKYIKEKAWRIAEGRR